MLHRFDSTVRFLSACPCKCDQTWPIRHLQSDRVYFLMSSMSVLNHCHMSILCVALVCSLAFPVRNLLMHICRISYQVHNKCSPMESKINTPTSNSTRLMWWASFTGCNQYVSLITDPLISNKTPVNKHRPRHQNIISNKIWIHILEAHLTVMSPIIKLSLQSHNYYILFPII